MNLRAKGHPAREGGTILGRSPESSAWIHSPRSNSRIGESRAMPRPNGRRTAPNFICWIVEGESDAAVPFIRPRKAARGRPPGHGAGAMPAGRSDDVEQAQAQIGHARQGGDEVLDDEVLDHWSSPFRFGRVFSRASLPQGPCQRARLGFSPISTGDSWEW